MILYSVELFAKVKRFHFALNLRQSIKIFDVEENILNETKKKNNKKRGSFIRFFLKWSSFSKLCDVISVQNLF